MGLRDRKRGRALYELGTAEQPVFRVAKRSWKRKRSLHNFGEAASDPRSRPGEDPDPGRHRGYHSRVRGHPVVNRHVDFHPEEHHVDEYGERELVARRRPSAEKRGHDREQYSRYEPQAYEPQEARACQDRDGVKHLGYELPVSVGVYLEGSLGSRRLREKQDPGKRDGSEQRTKPEYRAAHVFPSHGLLSWHPVSPRRPPCGGFFSRIQPENGNQGALLSRGRRQVPLSSYSPVPS